MSTDKPIGIFDAIKEDHQSGSTRILEQVIWACGKMFKLKQDPENLRMQLLHELENLQYHHPDLVILKHFSSELTKALETIGPYPEALGRWLDSYKSEWRDVNKLIARNLLDILKWDEFRILLHSHSGTLIEFARELQRQEKKAEIFQTLSEPGGEGITQAAELKNIGMDPIIIKDEEVIDLIGSINLVLFGADQISNYAWINKIGTLNIASIANQEGVQVWVLCDSRKIVEKVSNTNEIFEEIGIDFATGVITEKVKI